MTTTVEPRAKEDLPAPDLSRVQDVYGGEGKWLHQAAQSEFTLQADEETGDVIVAGWASRYTAPFEVYGWENEDGSRYSYQRKQEPGMFARSLNQNPKIALRLNHEGQFALTTAGTLRVWETEEGVRYEGRLSKKNQAAMDMAEEMRRGTLQESSIAYRVVRDRWETIEDASGNVTETQYVLEGNLNNGDVSVVLFGANGTTTSWLQGIEEALHRRSGQSKPVVGFEGAAPPAPGGETVQPVEEAEVAPPAEAQPGAEAAAESATSPPVEEAVQPVEDVESPQVNATVEVNITVEGEEPQSKSVEMLHRRLHLLQLTQRPTKPELPAN